VSATYDPLHDLEGTRLRKVVHQRQTQLQQKIDKTQLVIKSTDKLPLDWSIKNSLDI